jgi:hypothetical protein
LYEVLVDFTKDYSLIRAALAKIEHYDKTCLHDVLKACNSLLTSNWGSQSYAQVLMVTDLGIGLGQRSLKNLINSLPGENQPLPLPLQSKISIMCLGNPDDAGFKYGEFLRSPRDFLSL